MFRGKTMRSEHHTRIHCKRLVEEISVSQSTNFSSDWAPGILRSKPCGAKLAKRVMKFSCMKGGLLTLLDRPIWGGELSLAKSAVSELLLWLSLFVIALLILSCSSPKKRHEIVEQSLAEQKPSKQFFEHGSAWVLMLNSRFPWLVSLRALHEMLQNHVRYVRITIFFPVLTWNL